MNQSLYNSSTGRKRRPRKAVRAVGVMSRQLKIEVERYGITKLSTGLMLIGMGINVVSLNLR